MGFMSDVSRLMKVATKPDRREMWLVIRVTAIGMIGLGLIGFIIKLAGDVIMNGIKSGSSPSSTTGGFVIQAMALLIHLL